MPYPHKYPKEQWEGKADWFLRECDSLKKKKKKESKTVIPSPGRKFF